MPSAGQEFCERLAFYGLATNLVIYLQTVMGESASSAAVQCMLFEGSCYLSPILGAVLADSRWGRYKTILVFSGTNELPKLQMLCSRLHCHDNEQFQRACCALPGMHTYRLPQQRAQKPLKAIAESWLLAGIYLLGLACLAASACIPGLTPGPGQATASWPQNLVLFSSLYIVRPLCCMHVHTIQLLGPQMPFTMADARLTAREQTALRYFTW